MTPTAADARFERIEKRQDQYDQSIADVKRSQDRLDVIFTTFIDEMKELKAKDVDISLLLQNHEKDIEKQKTYWNQIFGLGRWAIGLFVAIGLLFLGTLITHIHF